MTNPSPSDDGYLRVYECAHVLVLSGGNPDFERCGFISASPGVCPYDHGKEVALVEIVASVLCSDCRTPVEREDCRAPDGRLVCGDCAMSYVGEETR